MTPRDELVEIRIDARRIAGTVLAPSRAVPGVLFVHGWGASRQEFLTQARAIARLGCVSLMFDLSGHGRSEGERDKVSREDNLRDLIGAYDLLAGRPGVDA